MPPIVLRWNPTRADIDDAMDVYRRAGTGLVLLFPYLGPFFLLLLGLGLLLLDQPYVAIFCALGAVFLTLSARRIVGRGTWRSAVVRQPVEAVVAPDALRMSSQGAASYSTTYQWSTFDRVVETERCFVLLGRKDRSQRSLFAYLPKRVVADPGELDRLRALLSSVVPPR